MLMAAHPAYQFVVAIAALAVVALVWGGVSLLRRGPAMRQKGVLMLIAAAVLAGNVAIWTV